MNGKNKQVLNNCSMLFKIGQTNCEIEFCRGMRGDCRFSLTAQHRIQAELIKLMQGSDSIIPVTKDDSTPMSHKRIKIAFSACPNACTLPQIKDVGIIAELWPETILHKCNQCWKCVSTCKENALKITGQYLELEKNCCIGCGTCIKQCPQKAIESNPVRLKVLVGGRMGRRPRWAEPMCITDYHNIIPIMTKIFTFIGRCMSRTRRFADIVETDGIVQLKEQIHYA